MLAYTLLVSVGLNGFLFGFMMGSAAMFLFVSWLDKE